MAPRKFDLTGHRYDALVVIAAAEPIVYPSGSKAARWLSACDCGASVTVVGSKLRSCSAVTCGDRTAHRSGKAHPMYGKRGEHSGNWKGNTIAYTSAHARVKAEHGSASDWRCACGCGRQANEWAYLGTDPEPKVSTHPDSKGALYSPDPEHYAPLAMDCHKRFDVWQAQRRTGLPLAVAVAEMLAA